MPDPKELLSSQDFAKKAGVSTSTVSKWLRSGKIQGSKQGGKWMIAADQLSTVSASGTDTQKTESRTTQPAKQPSASPPRKADSKLLTIEEFSAMTFLTPFGVERYLKEGRLSGTKNASGQWQVEASNLEKADIQRLVRK